MAAGPPAATRCKFSSVCRRIQALMSWLVFALTRCEVAVSMLRLHPHLPRGWGSKVQAACHQERICAQRHARQFELFLSLDAVAIGRGRRGGRIAAHVAPNLTSRLTAGSEVALDRDGIAEFARLFRSGHCHGNQMHL